jgi:hypothetical protein
MRFLVVLLALSACQTLSTEVLLVCNPEITVEPAEARPGDAVVLRGGPFGTNPFPRGAPWDLAVRVGGAAAEIVSVDLEDCGSCNSCRIEAGCQTCGACSDCELACATCEESATILTPEVAPGDWQVVAITSAGISDGASLRVLPALVDDSDTPDSDLDDTDPVDTDPVDTDPVDTDPADTDPADSDPADSDPADSDPADTAPEAVPPTDTDSAPDTDSDVGTDTDP